MKTKIYSLLVVFAIISFSCKALSLPDTNQTLIPESEKPISTEENENSQLTGSATFSTEWLTFLGVNNAYFDKNDIIQDEDGNIYFLIKQKDGESWNLYLIKVNTKGALAWSNFIATARINSNDSIAKDNTGNLYVASSSQETWGVPLNQFTQNGNNRLDSFIAKFDDMGKVIWNTFINSSNISNVVIDNNGGVYALKLDDHMENAKLIKLDGDGNQKLVSIDLSTLFETPYSFINLKIDKNENFYFSGKLFNSSFSGAWDCFVTKFTPNGSLSWKTVIGDQNGVQCDVLPQEIEIDNDGNIYLVGVSNTGWGNPLNPYDGGIVSNDPDSYPFNGEEVFVEKIDANGNLLWHTYFNKSTWISGSFLDINDNLYLFGNSTAGWGEPLNTHNGGSDGVFTILNPDGFIAWNYFIGGKGEDSIYYLFASNDYLYTVGGSNMSFGTPINPFSANNGNRDIFVYKLKLR